MKKTIMKKRIISIVLMIAIMLTFSACGDGANVNDDWDDDEAETTPTPETLLYRSLNALANESYSKIKLNITTVAGDIELGAEYELTRDKVSYSVDRLNPLPDNGFVDGSSDEYKTKLTGTADIEDGKVVRINGEEVNIPEYDELKGKFTFRKAFFENVISEDGSFSADVISPSGFFDFPMYAENMKVKVEYTDSGFISIKITYRTYNSSVTTVYEFEV